MSSIKTTQIDGDVSVGRNVSLGGKADIAGSAHIGHNLKVDGWLEAPNIKGANKGIFLTVQELREAYPVPHDGWMAGVGASTPFTAYVGKGGDWVPTGGTIEVTVDMTEEIEQARDDALNQIGTAENEAKSNVSLAKEEALDAIEEAIEGLEVHYDIETDKGATKDVQLKDGHGNKLLPKTSNKPFVDLEKKVVNLLGNYTPFIAASNTSLAIATDVNYRLSDPIPVREGDILNFRFGDNPSVNRYSVILNGNMEYVTYITAKESDRTLTCPANSAWLVMSYGRLRNGEDNKTPLLINGVEWEGIEHIEGINNIEDRIGYKCVEFKYNTTHSSILDRLRVNIKKGEQFVVRYNHSLGNYTQIYVNYGDSVQGTILQNLMPNGEYEFTAKDDIKYISVYGGSVEEEATVKLEVFYGNGSILPLLYRRLRRRNNIQLYRSSSRRITIEETYVAGDGLYIHPNTDWISRIALQNTWTQAKFAEHLGVELVTSPSGVENCIKIPTMCDLVFDSLNNKYAIKDRSLILEYDEILIAGVDGTIVYLGHGMETFVLKPLAEDLQKLLNNKEKAQFYVSGGYTKIEENKGAGKSIYIKFTNSLCVRIIASLTLSSMSQIAEHLGVELVTSPSGVENCIEIPNTSDLVFYTQTNKLAIKSRNNITRFDIVLLMCVDGTCKYIANGLQATYVEELSSIKTDVKSLQDSGAVVIGDIPTEANQFSALFKSAVGDVESFLLFSDPHFYSDYEKPVIKSSAVPYISKYKKYFDSTPTSFVLCCGDWLTKHRQTVAVQDLGQIDAQMNAMFPGCYYPVFGNHDDNYQGRKDDTDMSQSMDGQLNKQIVANLMFRKFGRAYYSFIGASSRFYVFDSCLDWYTSMDTYKWTQVDWFGKSLAENDDEHIILVTHIAELNYSDGPSGFGGNILPLIENVTLIAQAFNGRNSITLNGITYNFQSANGKVSLLICGHTHYDAMAVHNDIPMYNITTSSGDGRFDLILIDYTEKKLKSVRVGGGENRELAIL